MLPGLEKLQLSLCLQNRRAKWRKVGLKDDDSDKKVGGRSKNNYNIFKDSNNINFDFRLVTIMVLMKLRICQLMQ